MNCVCLELHLTPKTTISSLPARPEVKPPRKKVAPHQHNNKKRKHRKGDPDSDEDEEETFDVITTVSWQFEPKSTLITAPSRPPSYWVPHRNDVALNGGTSHCLPIILFGVMLYVVFAYH